MSAVQQFMSFDEASEDLAARVQFYQSFNDTVWKLNYTSAAGTTVYMTCIPKKDMAGIQDEQLTGIIAMIQSMESGIRPEMVHDIVTARYSQARADQLKDFSPERRLVAIN